MSTSDNHACELLGDGTYAITWVDGDNKPNWYQVDADEARRFCAQWYLRIGGPPPKPEESKQ